MNDLFKYSSPNLIIWYIFRSLVRSHSAMPKLVRISTTLSRTNGSRRGLRIAAVFYWQLARSSYWIRLIRPKSSFVQTFTMDFGLRTVPQWKFNLSTTEMCTHHQAHNGAVNIFNSFLQFLHYLLKRFSDHTGHSWSKCTDFARDRAVHCIMRIFANEKCSSFKHDEIKNFPV